MMRNVLELLHQILLNQIPLLNNMGNNITNRQIGAITFALIFQKFRLYLSYTCTHKSGAFALSFGVTSERIFSQL